MAAATTSGGYAVVQALRDSGVDLVFGIPGTHNLEIYRYLADSGIRHVAPRHEQGGGYAADGYARATGKPGVLITTSGPGLTNACTAAATAYADSIPLLLISPGMPRGLERADVGWLHEMKDQHGHLDTLVERSLRVESAQDAYAAICDAFAAWPARRPRPVHVEVPVDVLEAPMPASLGTGTCPRQEAPKPVSADLDRAAALLTTANDVVVIAGGGTRHATQPLRRLVETLGSAVLTTVNGKGVLPEKHPLSLGAAIRLPEAQRIAEKADALLVVGTELGDSDLWGGTITPTGAVVRIDIDSAQLQKNLTADVALCGDASEVLTALAERVASTARVSAASHRPAQTARTELAAAALREGARWLPFHEALAAALPDEVVVAGDSAQVSYFGTVHQWPMPAPGRFLYPTGYATLGYGLPAAIGAKLGCPDSPVLALVGDGGTAFTIQELLTAVDLRLPIPVVVMNNGGYGEIRDEMRARGIDPLAVDVRAPNFPALAEACGAHGSRADSPADLAEQVRAALTCDLPTVIEVPVPA